MRELRTFIAVPIVLPDEIHEKIGEFMYELADESIRWVNHSKLHVTLHFLGDIKEGMIDAISDVLEKGVSNLEGGTVEVCGLGYFGSKRSPRVIWAGLRDEFIFDGLKRSVDRALQSIVSKSDDRPFRPHLTLGRVKHIRHVESFHRLLEDYRDQFDVSVSIDRVVFYKSELEKRGPIYSPLKTVLLRQPGSGTIDLD